jgi:DNA-binding CsgD family transcriptional regulator
MTAQVDPPLLGRERELRQLDDVLDVTLDGSARVFVASGEPGIGKTRLLGELSRRADARGCLLLEGHAGEFERELPFAVLVDACDEFLASLDARKAQRLAGDSLAELAAIFPSLRPLHPEPPPAWVVDERFRAHRAVGELLERLAVSRPVLLVLDDVQWCDEASAELLAHLLRRPPKGSVCLALSHRSGQASPRLVDAFAGSEREGRLEHVELSPLSEAEAGRLVEGLDAGARRALYRESGGNPFYLQELARSPQPAAAAAGAAEPRVPLGTDADVPPAVAHAIGRELDALPAEARVVTESAAVAGDPFEPDVAADIAELPEADVLPALDAIAGAGLVRPTEVPRRFSFRHPIVRRVVYERTNPAWRLGAHGRAAAALAARGAPAAERAHHVEQSASRGDDEAIGLLREAGFALAPRAPASAARWLDAALRLLPAGDASAERRAELLAALAPALAASGRFGESRDVLLDLLELLPPEAAPLRLRVTAACASVEHVLGHHDDAHRRLRAAFDELPDQSSPEAVALMIELGVDAFYGADQKQMLNWGLMAWEAVGAIHDRPLNAAAAAILAWAHVIAGDSEAAQQRAVEAAARTHDLSDAEAAERIDALNHTGWAEHFIGRFHESLVRFERGITISQATGQGQFLLQLREGQANNLARLGRLDEAIAVSEQSIESARLSGSVQGLSWVLGGMCLWQTYAGNLEAAREAGEESIALASGLDPSVLSLVGAFDYASYLVEAGEPVAAIELAIEAAGGGELPRDSPPWVPFHCEILTRAHLAAGRQADAEFFAMRAGVAAEELGWSVAKTHAQRARAAALLGAGELEASSAAALESAEIAEGTGARLDAGWARLFAGRALAAAADEERAKSQLREAERTLHECGAVRWRDEATRELRKLGVRVERRPRGGSTEELGLGSLTVREREIAELVWDRKTNPQIAAELFLSTKTVETHLRNIFRKLDVSSRVEVARAVEQAREGER